MSPALLRALFITDPLIILATIFYGSVNLLVSLFESDGRRQVAIARAWARMLIRIAGVKVTVHGLEKVDPNASYIVASNHLSYMDTPVLLAHIPVQFRFMAKSSLFKIPFLGYHLHRAGHIPVPRENPREAIKAMNEAGRVIRERGISVLVFPEGGRTRDGNLQPFKEGGFYIAIKAGAPVLPVAIQGTRAIVPMGSLTVRPGHVTLSIGDPIPTAGVDIKHRAALAGQTRDQVKALLSQECASS